MPDPTMPPFRTEAEIRDALLTRALSGEPLRAFSDEEQKYLDPALLARLRRAAYLQWVDDHPAPDALYQWAEQMTAKYQSATVTVLERHRLPWVAALRVVRWGEEPRYWPAWDDNDLRRAEQWLKKDAHPTGVTYHIATADGERAITPVPMRRIAV